MNGLAALNQSERQGGGHRGLPYPAFSHHHDQAVAGARERVGQRVQPRQGLCRLTGGANVGGGRRRAAKQRAQRGQANRVEGAQRHLVLRQRF